MANIKWVLFPLIVALIVLPVFSDPMPESEPILNTNGEFVTESGSGDHQGNNAAAMDFGHKLTTYMCGVYMLFQYLNN